MTEVNETRLPGVGLLHDFTSRSGARVGVISHRTGRRELLVYDADDPDAVRDTVDLTPEESAALAELLGGARITERMAQLQRQVEGLAIDWLTVPQGSPFAGRTIGEGEIRRRTGVSVVALLRGEEAVPAPGPEVRLEAGDTAVVVGTPQGIELVGDLLRP